MSDRDEIDREWQAQHSSGRDAGTLSITDEGIEVEPFPAGHVGRITDTRTLVDIRDTLDRLIRRRQDDDQEPVPPDPVVTLPADSGAPLPSPRAAHAPGEACDCTNPDPGKPFHCAARYGPDHDGPPRPPCGSAWRPGGLCGRPLGHLGLCGDDPARFDGPVTTPAALLRIGRPDGPEYRFEIPPGARVLTYLQLDVNGLPVVRLSFHQHGRSLHTICSLVNPEHVTPVEW